MGANMRTVFWKEAAFEIIQTGKMAQGKFAEGHPVLRPFAGILGRNELTKTFMRGFVEARLKQTNQPGNMKQLLDLFDKSYGWFFTTQLELLGVRDEHAEHVVTHIGRAVGLTNAVLLWRKHAELGVTLLPADKCADNHVNLGLLQHLRISEKDQGVRNTLYDVMCQVKAEMNHVRDLMPLYPPEGWPILLEALAPNYYCDFLQRHNFDVTKYWTDDHIYGPGFFWYRYKKLKRWERSHQCGELVAEEAPYKGVGDLWHMVFSKRRKYRNASGDENVECATRLTPKENPTLEDDLKPWTPK